MILRCIYCQVFRRKSIYLIISNVKREGGKGLFYSFFIGHFDIYVQVKEHVNLAQNSIACFKDFMRIWTFTQVSLRSATYNHPLCGKQTKCTILIIVTVSCVHFKELHSLGAAPCLNMHASESLSHARSPAALSMSNMHTDMC